MNMLIFGVRSFALFALAVSPARNRSFYRIAFLMILASGCLWSPALYATPPPGYTQVWADEFNGTTLDSNYWSLGWPGSVALYRDAYNTLDAVSVAGGNLTITTYTENNVHYTALLDTEKKYQPLYGYMESRIQFVNQPGNWSAFWLWISSIGTGPDPHIYGTESDIVEHRAIDWYGNDIDAQIPSTIHWDGYGTNHKSVTSGLRGAGLDVGFHVYGMEWTPDYQKFYIDGVYLYTIVNSTVTDPVPPAVPVSHRSEGLYLSTEIEDLSWAGNIPAGGYGTLANSISKMTVDYVRVYQLNPVAPVVPANFVVANVNHREIALSWKLSDNGTSYHVKRSLTSGGPYTTIATTSVGYTDTDVTDDKTYYYVVSALNGTAESADTAQVSATPLPSDTRSGLRSAMGTLPGTVSWGAIVQMVSVPSNTAYQAGCWIKGSGKVRFMIRPGYNGNPPLADQFINATPTWTYYSATFNTGAQTQLTFYVGDGSSTAGTVYVDDTFMGPPGGANVLGNPGFESGATSWYINQVAIWSMPITANVHAGLWSLRGVLPGTVSWNALLQAPTTVATNTAYQAGFWMKGSGQVRFMIRPGYNGNPPLISQFINATPTWTYYTASFNTGANTQLTFYLGDSSSTPGTIYVDDTFMGVLNGTNLLVNPGFESGSTSWTINPTPSTILKVDKF